MYNYLLLIIKHYTFQTIPDKICVVPNSGGKDSTKYYCPLVTNESSPVECVFGNDK